MGRRAVRAVEPVLPTVSPQRAAAVQCRQERRGGAERALPGGTSHEQEPAADRAPAHDPPLPEAQGRRQLGAAWWRRRRPQRRRGRVRCGQGSRFRWLRRRGPGRSGSAPPRGDRDRPRRAAQCRRRGAARARRGRRVGSPHAGAASERGALGGRRERPPHWRRRHLRRWRECEPAVRLA